MQVNTAFNAKIEAGQNGAINTFPALTDSNIRGVEMATSSLAELSFSPQPTPHVAHEVSTFPYLINATDVVLKVVFEGDPCSKSLSTKKSANSNSRTYQGVIGKLLKARCPATADATSLFGLRCLFFRRNRQRIDCDNLLKAVSDSATGVIWRDDSQVMEVFGRLFLASERPRVEILIHRVADTASRPLCCQCGQPYKTYPSSPNRRHCSVSCANASKRVERACQWCAALFTLPRSIKSKGYCSRECAMKANGARKTESSGPHLWRCIDCGGPVSRAEYKRCAGCALAHRREPTSNYWRLRRPAETGGNS